MLTVDFDVLGLSPGDRALDVGCGAGRHAFEMYRRGAQVVALDRDAAGLKDAGAILAAMHDEVEKAQGPTTADALVTMGDALHLPFPNGAFSRVVVSEVLEHVADDRAVLTELARVLAPGGMLGVTVPRWFPELACWTLSNDYYDAPGGHIRIYRRANLEAKLRAAGLTVIGHHHAHGLHSAYWWLRCIDGVAKNPEHEGSRLLRWYHRMLVRDIVEAPASTRRADRVLTPIMGKSLVVYAQKAEAA